MRPAQQARGQSQPRQCPTSSHRNETDRIHNHIHIRKCNCSHRKMLSAPVPLLLLLLLALLGGDAAAESEPSPRRTHFLPNRTALVDLFEWTFAEVAAECRDFLGPRGFAGVQLSPVTEHAEGAAWRQRFHPVSYAVASRSGDADAFREMARACNAAGVRVYVDVVLNHMAAPGAEAGTELRGTAGASANASALAYPAVPYGRADFHAPCALANYADGLEVRNCQLDGRPDLDHSRAEVRGRVVALLDALVDLGAAGFHVDAAKYMWPSDLKAIFSEVKDLNSAEFDFPERARPFFYQDVVDVGTDAVSKTEYSGHGVVSDYLYAAELATVFGGQVPLSALINWGPAMGFLPHHDALVFVDTPVAQRGRLPELGRIRLLSHQERARLVMATAFMLAHPYGGVKRIASSYRFAAADPDQGPPAIGPAFDAAGQCAPASGWVCEHRWPAVASMVELAGALDEVQDSVINFQTDGPQHVAFCRGHRAFVALNNDAARDFEAVVFTCLEAGVYCDVVSGGRAPDGSDCLGRRVVVDGEGNARILLKAPVVASGSEDDAGDGAEVEYGVLAIYVGSRLEADSPKPTGASSEAAAAAAVTPAVAEEATEEDPDGHDEGETKTEATNIIEEVTEEEKEEDVASTEAQEVSTERNAGEDAADTTEGTTEDTMETTTEDPTQDATEDPTEDVECVEEAASDCASAAEDAVTKAGAVVGDAVGSDVEEVPAEVMAAAAKAAQTHARPAEEADVGRGSHGPTETFTFSPLR